MAATTEKETAAKVRMLANSYRKDVRTMREAAPDDEALHEIAELFERPYRIVADELDKIAKELTS